MKISYNWLKSLVNLSLSADETAARLTAAGLEVEGIEVVESIPGGLKGLVVGKVESCEKHPDADRLNLTKVNIGSGDLLNIVCGAPNVAAGQKVIVATIGAKLYPSEGEPFEIKKSKIRGAVSEGMLCAEDEIGLGKSHAGIMVLPEAATVGLAAADYFKLENDQVFEIGLTPNRSDAASHLGVARDLVAILKTEGIAVNDTVSISGMHTLPTSTNTSKVELVVEAKEACKRYSGLAISGVEVKESPDWLKNRLTAIGLRPINNIVDSTNFVLHELGQPLHAFDLEKIADKKIVVRLANEGEEFITLDGLVRKLKSHDLMICDSKVPMCIAGVFGGANSGVTDTTSAIFLESAFFDSAYVRKSSKQHGLKTDASFRFERGTDPEMTMIALQRCANLILELAGGVISAEPIDYYPEKLEPYKIAFSFSNCRDLIGKDIDRQTVVNIIRALGIMIEKEGNDGLLLAVPRFKTDVTREADVIEEVMRIYGYNNVEVSKTISYTAFASTRNFDEELSQRTASLLEGFGFFEMMNLSLSSDSNYANTASLVAVVNPLSNDLNVMRAKLLFGGLSSLAYNINRQQSDLRLYEFGRVYRQSEQVFQEEKQVLLLATGNIYAQNPHQLSREADTLYLKGICEQLAAKCGLDKLEYIEFSDDNFDFGIEAQLNKKTVFNVGMVNRKTLKKADISQPVAAATINWQILVKAFSKQKTTFSELSKFPTVRRDLALLINRDIKFAELKQLAFATEKKFLTEVNLFDIYEGEKLGNKKSYALSFTLLNKEATLTDKQIETVMDKLIATYKEKVGAELR